LLAASAIFLELTALWFQYGMGLDPCVKCVYERLAVFGIAAAGLIGLASPQWPIVRLVAYATWLVSAAWGLRLALQHVGIQQDPAAAFNCTFAAEFPDWARLDEWLPALFQPTGYCDDIQWQWLGLTMAQWMVPVFSIYLLILAAVLIVDARASLRPQNGG
jgi:disulfide bond formation protein DsbB